MLRSSANCKVIAVAPSELLDVIESIPAMVENCCSSGVATADAIVSGVAPGRLAVTTIVGKTTLGRSLTGRNRKAIAPKTHNAPVSRVVITGRRMQRRQIHGFGSPAAFDAGRRPRSLRLDPGTRHEAEMAVGHDRFARARPSK